MNTIKRIHNIPPYSKGFSYIRNNYIIYHKIHSFKFVRKSYNSLLIHSAIFAISKVFISFKKLAVHLMYNQNYCINEIILTPNRICNISRK